MCIMLTYTYVIIHHLLQTHTDNHPPVCRLQSAFNYSFISWPPELSEIPMTGVTAPFEWLGNEAWGVKYLAQLLVARKHSSTYSQGVHSKTLKW